MAEPYILLGDTCIIGFFFVAGTVFFEKQERTLSAIVSTPLRFSEYLAAKLTLLVLISLIVAFIVPTISSGFGYRPLTLAVAVVLGTLLMLLVGFATSLPFASISDWFLAATIPLAVMTVPPVLYYSGVWPSPLAYVVPTTGPLLLLGEAFGQSDSRAVAGDLRGRIPDRVRRVPVVGGQGFVRAARHRAVGRCVMSARREDADHIRPQRCSRHLS